MNKWRPLSPAHQKQVEHRAGADAAVLALLSVGSVPILLHPPITTAQVVMKVSSELVLDGAALQWW